MRYIDADKLKEKKVYSEERHELVVPVAEIDWLPTEDVVPKAEVEEQLRNIKQESTDFYCSFTQSKIQNCPIQNEVEQAKQEVASSIFKEIDNTIYADTDFFKMLRKKYIGE